MSLEHDRRPRPGRVAPVRRDDDDRRAPTALHRLQATAGNRAVAQLLAGRDRAAATRPPALAVQRNAKFDAAGGKAFDAVDAPDAMGLPPELQAGMEAAWAASFPDGKSMEQGGILVKTAAGAYEWRAGQGTSGASFRPNYADVKPGEVLIASGHTHPYDATEGGHTGVSFSGGDLANLVFQQERVKVVQSGTAQFAVAKTAEFDALVAAADTKDAKLALRREIDALWNDTIKGTDAKLSFQERVEIAAKAVCAKYHLVYYAGSGGTVAQPGSAAKPKAHVEAVTKPPTGADGLPPVPSVEEAQQEAPEGGAVGPAPQVQQSWLKRLWGKITSFFSGK